MLMHRRDPKEGFIAQIKANLKDETNPRTRAGEETSQVG